MQKKSILRTMATPDNSSDFQMKKWNVLILLMVLLCCSITYGKTVVPGMNLLLAEWEMTRLQDPRGSILVKRPKNWEYLNGAFGLTHVFMTNPKLKNRTSISLTVTGINNLDFGPNNGAKEYGEYKAGRLAWASKMGAIISQFTPYSYAKGNYAYDIHKGGVAYELSGVHYQELSYFIVCKGKSANLIHLKALSRDSEENLRPIMDEMSHNLKCL